MMRLSTKGCRGNMQPRWATPPVTQLLLYLILGLGLVGCGGTDYPGATLAGTVTVDGQPLANGTIVFMPQQQGHGGGVKATIRNGRYRAEGVPLGSVLVTFSAVQQTGRMIESELYAQPMPEQINLIPEKHRAGMELEVSGDNDKQDFNL